MDSYLSGAGLPRALGDCGIMISIICRQSVGKGLLIKVMALLLGYVAFLNLNPFANLGVGMLKPVAKCMIIMY